MSQAAQLYQIVPALYRNRDTGDLQKYFQGAGILLDQIQQTLEQKLADNFSDNPLDNSQGCQEWLLPYFADLLDVRLVSPLVRGKRDEIANAVRWRQGKGTLRVVEEVAEAVGQLEVVVQEGWKKVATTARLNVPLIPATAYGYSEDAPASPPGMASKHPGLPAVTIDFRCPAAAVSASSGNPAARQSTVDSETQVWRQASLHGNPCHPGSFDDPGKRTVDFRCPDWRVGHVHPDNILLFIVPPAGFFKPALPGVNWSDTPSENFLALIDVIEEGDLTIYRNKTFGTEYFVPVRVRRVIKLGQEPDGVGSADPRVWQFDGLILENTLEADSGRVVLNQCAARKVEVHSIDTGLPVITAKDCLFKNIQAARGQSKLEYCTVLETTLSEVVYASDCIFMDIIKKDHAIVDAPEEGCLRFSTIARQQLQGGMKYFSVTDKKPIFFENSFGERSCGVLHPASDAAITGGAEDGAEMGAYHHRYHSLLADAVEGKLKDYLPLGSVAVVIPDPNLLNLKELS